MLFDKLGLFFDGAAYNASSGIVDAGAAGAGKGEPVRIHFQGHSLTTAGTITVTLRDSATSGSGQAALMAMAGLTAAEVNEGIFFTVPATAKRYLDLTVTAATGGTMTSGVVLDSQSNL